MGLRPLSSERDFDSSESREMRLQRNLRTYEAAEVFSAGKVRILEEFEDGRLLIESTASLRVKTLEVVQEIPFVMAECEALPVTGLSPKRWEAIYNRMKELLGVHFVTLDKELLSKSDSQDVKFFHLLSRFQWPAENIQQFLEIEDVNDMADSLVKTLSGVELVTSPEIPLHKFTLL